MTFSNFTGFASIVIFIAAAMLWAFRMMHIPRRVSSWLTLAVAIFVCIPISHGGLPLAAYLRGATGDLSITTLVLLTCSLCRYLFGWPTLREEERVVLSGVIALFAIALYPLALGIGYFDPYRWGFGNSWFLGGLLIITLIAYWKKYFWVALCIALAVLAWAVGWNESNNVWNYLLDPFVAIYAGGYLLFASFQMLKKSREHS